MWAWLANQENQGFTSSARLIGIEDVTDTQFDIESHLQRERHGVPVEALAAHVSADNSARGGPAGGSRKSAMF